MKKLAIAVILTMTCETVVGGNTHALIVTGINKEAKDRLIKEKAVVDLRDHLLKRSSIEPSDVAVLAHSRSMARTPSEVSTAENVKTQIDRFATMVTPADRCVFYYVGQANVVAEKLRINLPGPDITHEQLAEWLSKIRASSMLIVLDCPGSGIAVKALAGQGRIVVAGCTADQPYSTRFSEYFVPALGANESDTDNDGKVSLLEAFTSASRQLDDFYRSVDLLKTETPLLEDDRDGKASSRPWRFKWDKTDGAAASEFFLSNKP